MPTKIDKQLCNGLALSRPKSAAPRLVCIRRGPKGFGFNMAGSCPCYLSAVHDGGPAALGGLKLGDQILKVNDADVVEMPHQAIVSMVTQSSQLLRLMVISPPAVVPRANSYQALDAAAIENGAGADASNEASGISAVSRERRASADLVDSDAEVWRRQRQRFRRSRSAHSRSGSHRSSSMEELFAPRPGRRGSAQPARPSHRGPSHCPKHSSINSHHSKKATVASLGSAALYQTASSKSSRHRNYPAGAKKCSNNGNKRSSSNRKDNYRSQQLVPSVAFCGHNHRTTGFRFGGRKMSAPGGGKHRSQKRKMNRSASEPDVYLGNHDNQTQTSMLVHAGMDDSSDDSSLSAAGSSVEAYSSDSTEDATSQDEDASGQLIMRAVIAYIGAVPVPPVAGKLSKRRIIRSGICSLNEQKVKAKNCLLEIFAGELLLRNARHEIIAGFSGDRIIFAAPCKENKTYFGIATAVGPISPAAAASTTFESTTTTTSAATTSCSEFDSDNPGGATQRNRFGTGRTADPPRQNPCVCHIFAVDPGLHLHSIHYQLAKQFGIECSRDPETNMCLEFPYISGPVVSALAYVYRTPAIQKFGSMARRGVAMTTTTDSGSSSNGSPRKGGVSGGTLAPPHGAIGRHSTLRKLQQLPPQQRQNGYQSSTSDSGIGNIHEDIVPAGGAALRSATNPPKNWNVSQNRRVAEIDAARFSDASLSSTSVVSNGVWGEMGQCEHRRSKSIRGVRFLDDYVLNTAAQQMAKFQKPQAQLNPTSAVNGSCAARLPLQSGLAPILKQASANGPLMPTPAPTLNCWLPLQQSSGRVMKSASSQAVFATCITAAQIHDQRRDLFRNANRMTDNTDAYTKARSASSRTPLGSREELEAELENIKRITADSTPPPSATHSLHHQPRNVAAGVLAGEKRAQSVETLEDRRYPRPPGPFKSSSIPTNADDDRLSYQGSNNSSRSSTLVRDPSRDSRPNEASVSRAPSHFSSTSCLATAPAPSHSHGHSEPPQKQRPLSLLQKSISIASSSSSSTTRKPNAAGAPISRSIDENSQPSSATTQHLDVPSTSAAVAGASASGGGSNTASLRQKFNRLARGETLGIGNRAKQERREKLEVWANDFDRLLRDPAGLHAFAEFLKKQYSHENVLFWIACENYKTASDKEMKKIAQDIYTTHFATFCPQPVNIDSSARHKVETALNEEKFTKDLFATAQYQILQLMKYDCYPRFVKSDEYSHLWDLVEKGLPFKEQKEPYQKSSVPLRADSSKSLENERAQQKASTSTLPPPVPVDDKKSRRSILPWKGKLGGGGGKKKKEEGAAGGGSAEDMAATAAAAGDDALGPISDAGADRRRSWKNFKQLSMPAQPANLVQPAAAAARNGAGAPQSVQNSPATAVHQRHKSATSGYSSIDRTGGPSGSGDVFQSPSPPGDLEALKRPQVPSSALTTIIGSPSHPPPDVVPRPDPPIVHSPLPSRASQQGLARTASPDCSCVVVLPTNERRNIPIVSAQGLTIRQLLHENASAIGLNPTATDVMDPESNTLLDQSLDAAKALGGRTVHLAGGVLFKVDIPPPTVTVGVDAGRRKVIAVKGSVGKTSAQVLRPILSRYGLQLDNLVVSVVGTNEVLPNHAPITKADGKKLVVLSHEEFTEWVHRDHDDDSLLASPVSPCQSPRYSPGAAGDSSQQQSPASPAGSQSSPTIEEISQKPFEQIHSPQSHCYLGIVELPSESPYTKLKSILLRSNDSGGSGMLKFVRKSDTTSQQQQQQAKARLTPTLSLSSTKSSNSSSSNGYLEDDFGIRSPAKLATKKLSLAGPAKQDWRETAKEEKELTERLNRAQATRLDDQRGPLPASEIELPDFLKPAGGEATPESSEQFRCVVAVSSDLAPSSVDSKFVSRGRPPPIPSKQRPSGQAPAPGNISVIAVGGLMPDDNDDAPFICPTPANTPARYNHPVINSKPAPLSIPPAAAATSKKRGPPPPYPGKPPAGINGSCHSSQGSFSSEGSPSHHGTGSISSGDGGGGTISSTSGAQCGSLGSNGRSRKPVCVEDLTVKSESWKVDYV